MSPAPRFRRCGVVAALVVLVLAAGVGTGTAAAGEGGGDGARAEASARRRDRVVQAAGQVSAAGEVSAAGNSTFFDSLGDTNPIDVCEGDVEQYRVVYEAGVLAVSLKTRCPTNAGNSPHWNPGITSAFWSFDVDGDNVEDYYVDFVNEDGSPSSIVFDTRGGGDPVPVCQAVPYFDGSFTVAHAQFDPACIGNPGRITIQVFFLWDEAPFEDDCVCPFDIAPDSGWSPFVYGPVPNVPAGDGPGAASAAEGTIDVFARGGDDALWTRRFDGANWSPWSSLGGRITGTPAAASAAAGELDVFVRGADNGLWTRHFDGATWSTWSSLSGVLSTPPAVVSASPGTIDVFVAGQDTALWTRHFDGVSWGAWSSQSGRVTATPAVASSDPNVMDVFVRGADSAVWSKHFDGVWGYWVPNGGSITTAPAAASSDPGSVEVFARGTDNALWTASSPVVSWGSLGGTIASPPAAVSPAAGQMVVFARGTDGALWTNRRPAGTWEGWISLGGTIR